MAKTTRPSEDIGDLAYSSNLPAPLPRHLSQNHLYRRSAGGSDTATRRQACTETMTGTEQNVVVDVTTHKSTHPSKGFILTTQRALSTKRLQPSNYHISSKNTHQEKTPVDYFQDHKMAATTESMHDDKPDGWSPRSWQSKPVQQGVDYRDKNALEKVCRNLEAMPPLVSPAQIEEAREAFASAAKGERFIIQGGDCAESFEDVRLDIINSKTSLLLEQADFIESKLMLPVTCVGRIAGQYAKPRSNPKETLSDGSTVNAFRGHIINGTELDQRSPDPNRLLHGYFYSAVTLNAISVIESQNNSAEATRPATPVNGSLAREDSIAKPTFAPREILTSHEALLLPYDSSLTRGRYCTSAAFLWVGERTRQLNGAHVEFLRGIRNPIGIKLSAKASPNEVVALLDALSPIAGSSEPGKFTLITRLGASNVQSALPALINAVQASGHQPLWMSDPCHGNTAIAGAEKIKTRCATTMLDEALQTWDVHRAHGSYLGGLHLEQTGEGVIECVEHIAVGTGDLSLGVNYRTLCDPRLSREQALLFVERFAEYVHEAGLGERAHGEIVEEKIVEKTVELLNEKQAAIESVVVLDDEFVADHPEELAAFAYQPALPLLPLVA
ncbi:MAG: hypothetical protein Q9218_005991 [Villophora microphyllina]